MKREDSTAVQLDGQFNCQLESQLDSQLQGQIDGRIDAPIHSQLESQSSTDLHKRTKAANNRATFDPQEIRAWAEARGGCPARVRGTGKGCDAGIIRIDFPGFSGFSSLEPISWEEFFEKFDEKQLALLIQEETAHGQRSRFNRLVKRAALEPKRAVIKELEAGSRQSTGESASRW